MGRVSAEPPIQEHTPQQHLGGRGGPPPDEGYLPPGKVKSSARPGGRVNSGRSSLGSARSDGEWDGQGLPAVRA